MSISRVYCVYIATYRNDLASSFFSSIVKVNLSTKAKLGSVQVKKLSVKKLFKLRSGQLRSSKSRSCFYLSNIPGIKPHAGIQIIIVVPMGPLHVSDHMVQKPPYWNANCALGPLNKAE